MLNIATKQNNLLVVLLILTHGFSALASESSSNLGEILEFRAGSKVVSSAIRKSKVEPIVFSSNFDLNDDTKLLAQSAWGTSKTKTTAPRTTATSTRSTKPATSAVTAGQPLSIANPKAPPADLETYAPIGSEASPYAFHSYRLSYMQSDRVLGLLKALGYSTVEYSAMRAESVNESIFTALAPVQRYPIIVKILDAAKTSLLQPALDGGRSPSGADRLSGTYLHQSTTGAPEQRFLIIYEKKSPEQLNGLLNLLRNEVDVAASQIVIEALVVEINSNKAKELGFKYNLTDNKTDTSLNAGKFSSTFNSNQRDKFQWNTNRNSGFYSGQGYDSSTYTDDVSAIGTYYPKDVPLYGAFERIAPLGFQATLDAFISDGTAEVLTNPTILVLDGRQAMIRIGTQIPNETIQTTNYGTQKSVKYIDTGIVLNVRPRISEDGAEVTMQTETIVSSAIYDASEASLKPEERSPPSIESKTVQSFVRVADNTPFIIGGLIDKKKSEGETGIPGLSKIPLLGNLFKSKAQSGSDREVIIVLTPHIIDTNEKSFSYVIPKDSETFDSFNNELFRNAYRIRDEDLFDLSFATKSKFYQETLEKLKEYKTAHPEVSEDEPIFDYLKNKVPGEEVIVRRMIWEIVHKSKYHQYIADDHILVFEGNQKAKYGNKFNTHFLNKLFEKLQRNKDNSLVLNFADYRANLYGPFEHPRAKIFRANVSNPGHYVQLMTQLNAEDPNRNTLLLSNAMSPPGVRGANALEVLKGVLVLKRILALNRTMPVTINEFRVGRQITFPTEQELKDKYHVIDYDAARYFYDVINYYPEFEKAFNRDSAMIIYQMQEIKTK
jgi:Flp pilus assembly secretin CpaC